jgi:hypothetical protein
MPRYALEILEKGGGTTKGEHESPEGKWYDEGHYFQHEGRLLRVKLIKDAGGSYDQLLICAPAE